MYKIIDTRDKVAGQVPVHWGPRSLIQQVKMWLKTGKKLDINARATLNGLALDNPGLNKKSSYWD